MTLLDGLGEDSIKGMEGNCVILEGDCVILKFIASFFL
jgi:hypothetical protein